MMDAICGILGFGFIGFWIAFGAISNYERIRLSGSEIEPENTRIAFRIALMAGAATDAIWLYHLLAIHFR